MCHYDEDHECEDTFTCKMCGESGLHWADIYYANGEPGRRLFNIKNRKHECGGAKANPDDFDVVPE